MNSLPTWATWSIVAAAALSPVLAFLMAMRGKVSDYRRKPEIVLTDPSQSTG